MALTTLSRFQNLHRPHLLVHRRPSRGAKPRQPSRLHLTITTVTSTRRRSTSRLFCGQVKINRFTCQRPRSPNPFLPAVGFCSWSPSSNCSAFGLGLFGCPGCSDFRPTRNRTSFCVMKQCQLADIEMRLYLIDFFFAFRNLVYYAFGNGTVGAKKNFIASVNFSSAIFWLVTSGSLCHPR